MTSAEEVLIEQINFLEGILKSVAGCLFDIERRMRERTSHLQAAAAKMKEQEDGIAGV